MVESLEGLLAGREENYLRKMLNIILNMKNNLSLGKNKSWQRKSENVLSTNSLFFSTK